jgi:hypothetical protein
MCVRHGPLTGRLGWGRPEMVVGWYHSHPGFGCWLSGVDINTQQVHQERARERDGRTAVHRGART